MWIAGNIIFRSGIQIGEVAMAAARDQYFFPDFLVVFQDQDRAPALSGSDGAHEAGGTRSNDNCLKTLSHVRGELRKGFVGCQCNYPKPLDLQCVATHKSACFV